MILLRRLRLGLSILAALIASPLFVAADALRPRVEGMTFDVPAEGPVEFRGAFAISPPVKGFGGLSGLVRLGPGAFLAVTDRANWVHLGLDLQDGHLKGVTSVRLAPMVDGNGDRLQGGGIDAEDLTRDPVLGSLWISFEADHRIWQVNEPSGRPVASFRHPEWEQFSVNTGLEALARDEQGRLWAIREASGDHSRPFPVYIRDGDKWLTKSLPRPSEHLVTGADFGPDGWMYVTERDFSFTGGFDFRLRRVKWGEGEIPVAEETLIELPSSSAIDNIEGVAVWREGGEILIMLVSDDNLFLLQRNVVALFALSD